MHEYLSNVFLKSFDAVRSYNKPEFQGSKSSAQWNAPMLLNITRKLSIEADIRRNAISYTT